MGAASKSVRAAEPGECHEPRSDGDLRTFALDLGLLSLSRLGSRERSVVSDAQMKLLPAPKKPKYKPLSRFEISVAEVMRLNMPRGAYSEPSYELWLDLIDSLSALFSSGTTRFNSEEWLEHCFGGIPLA